MEVIVDGNKDFELEGEPQDMLAVVGAVSTFLQEQNRAMLGIEIDGKNIPPEELQETLTDVDITTVQVIKIQSEDMVSLVNETLSELEEYLPELAVACHSLAEVFHGENPDEGFDPLTQLITIWGEVKQRELQVANAIQLNLGEVQLDGQDLESCHQKLNTYLEECIGALEKGDCVLLGDLLEYELAPRAEQEVKIAGLLKERATAHFA